MCVVGYYLVNQYCARCPLHCKNCLDGNKCIQCSEGYGLMNDKSCEKCVGNCPVCNPMKLFYCE